MDANQVQATPPPGAGRGLQPEVTVTKAHRPSPVHAFATVVRQPQDAFAMGTLQPAVVRHAVTIWVAARIAARAAVSIVIAPRAATCEKAEDQAIYFLQSGVTD